MALQCLWMEGLRANLGVKSNKFSGFVQEAKPEGASLCLTVVVVAGKFGLCALLPCALPGSIASTGMAPWKGGVGRR